MTTTISNTTECICCKGLVPIGLALCDWCWGRCVFGEAHKEQGTNVYQHKPQHTFSVVDDGTMDTVLQCNDCQQSLRYNFQGMDIFDDMDERDPYEAFVEWCMDEAARTHDCDKGYLAKHDAQIVEFDAR